MNFEKLTMLEEKMKLGILTAILCIISGCIFNTTDDKFVYHAKVSGRSLVCNKLGNINYGLATLEDCTCWHTGQKIGRALSVSNFYEKKLE